MLTATSTTCLQLLVTIRQVQYNFARSEWFSEVVAAAHGSFAMQATIYDDLHMGEFVAVVVSFTNQKTEHAGGGVRYDKLLMYQQAAVA